MSVSSAVCPSISSSVSLTTSSSGCYANIDLSIGASLYSLNLSGKSYNFGCTNQSLAGTLKEKLRGYKPGEQIPITISGYSSGVVSFMLEIVNANPRSKNYPQVYFPTNFLWNEGIPPFLSNGRDMLGFYSTDGVTYKGFWIGRNLK